MNEYNNMEEYQKHLYLAVENYLALCILKTLKWVLLQKVNTQMKCHI